eukprot:154373-Chlamydomonas_euryale.AAC.2
MHITKPPGPRTSYARYAFVTDTRHASMIIDEHAARTDPFHVTHVVTCTYGRPQAGGHTREEGVKLSGRACASRTSARAARSAPCAHRSCAHPRQRQWHAARAWPAAAHAPSSMKHRFNAHSTRPLCVPTHVLHGVRPPVTSTLSHSCQDPE